jgi:DNA-binding CsgD family transcriptional regulator
VSSEDPIGRAFDALEAGRWADARAAFDQLPADAETADTCFGQARALWWLGENEACVERCGRAYSRYRATGDRASAAMCAVWLAITYKANFANFAAANGWIGRAERVLEPMEVGPAHGWVWIARAYRMLDLDSAEELTERALRIAEATADVDLELTALAQLGLVRVGKGDSSAGFALIDEAMAAALAGERSTLDTVVYACCDMLHACELASDVERATQWCKVADDFVATYGCPFLYAECRIYYGSVLTATGRWDEAAQELHAGARISAGACPALHARALARLADLRIRQGRFEDAATTLELLHDGVEGEVEVTLLTAALALARGDAQAASRLLAQSVVEVAGHRRHLATALALLVDAHLAEARVAAAADAADRLRATAALARSPYLTGLAALAAGRVAIAGDDPVGAAAQLQTALEAWSVLDVPFEVARARSELARALAAHQPAASIDHARRALAGFEQLGAAVEADRVAAFLRSVGVVARSGPKGVGVLTRREREVLRLVGAGLSNPEIAARLHISRRTASHHVSNVLMRLGVRNRAEAAVRAVAVLGDEAPPAGRA